MKDFKLKATQTTTQDISFDLDHGHCSYFKTTSILQPCRGPEINTLGDVVRIVLSLFIRIWDV
jgi:hypothetical protein